MSSSKNDTRARDALLAENEDLRRRLEEAEQTLEAIRHGEVDAIVVAGARGDQIYSLTGAEHTYRVIIETMNEAALTMGLDGTILFSNQRFCDLMRTPLCDVVGHQIAEFVAEPQRPALAAAMREAQRESVQRRLTLRAEDGAAVPVLLSLSLLQTPDSVSLCLVASDLTELEESANSIRILREHEQALQESEARFRAIFESSRDAVIIADDEGVCVQANPAVQTVLGLPPELFLGRPIWDFLGEAVHAAAIWRQFRAAGSFRGEFPIVDADQQRRHVDLDLVAGILPGRHLCVIRDITERQLARDALLKANEQLQIQAEEMEVQTEELRVTNEELHVNELALRDSEERLRFALETSHIGAWDFDLENHVSIRSLEHARILGYSELTPEWTYEKFLAHVLPEDRGMVEEQFHRAVETQRDLNYECRIRREDDAVRWIWVAGRNRVDAASQTRRITGIIQDITERKEAEKTLRESEERFHRLFEDDLTGDCISTPEGQILLCNPSFARIFGFSRAVDAVGTSMVDLYLDPGERERLVERLRDEGKIAAFEAWRKRCDGESIYVIETLVGHFNDQGELYEIKGYIFNDTDRKRAEEALRESEQRLRLALDAGGMGTWVWDLATDTVDADSLHHRLWDLDGADARVPASVILQRIHPEDRGFAFDRDSAEHRLAGPIDVEFRILRRDGGVTWLAGSAVPVRDADGVLRKVIGVNFDITDRKRAEEALRELNATLENKVTRRTAELEYRARQLQKLALELSQAEERERRRLAEILHDDLQQQLAAVKFHLGILAGRARGDGGVQNSAAQLDKMLRDAIETSRSLSHELSPAVMYHGDMGEILEWLANQIHIKHGMIVRVVSHGQIDVESDALKIFLFKAVQEMLFNAVKHARVGEARVRMLRRGRYVSLCVSDRGRGFDPQELKKTAGFGLMSIRERIGLLGGRMRIHSVRGRGSRLIITVPDGPCVGKPAEATSPDRSAVDVAAEAASMSQEGGRASTPLRVLIADDHEVVRHGLASLLAEAKDIELVGQAGNGREAVDLAYQLRPDVVIMDVAMPLMNGDEAARQILRHLPQTRIVALSMYDEAGAVERMHRAGAESYILKTAPAAELLAAVRGSEQGQASALVSDSPAATDV